MTSDRGVTGRIVGMAARFNDFQASELLQPDINRIFYRDIIRIYIYNHHNGIYKIYNPTICELVCLEKMSSHNRNPYILWLYDATRWCPPSDVSWFIVPLTIDISTINPSY